VLDLLGLCGLDFSARTSSLLSFFNASALQSLQLSQCKNIGPLFIALAAEFKHSCSLVEFDITLIDAPTLELRQALDGALDVMGPNLRCLWLQSKAGGNIDINHVTRHGPSLRQLGIEGISLHIEPILSVNELSAMLAACPHLEGLAIHLCPISLGKILDLASNFDLGRASSPGTSDLRASLVSLLQLASKVLH
jgi:hypothetical protein